jgi:hypothetical protein
MNMATWTVVGIALGTAMGAATHNMSQWVALGGALGLVMGAIAIRRDHGKAS